MFRTLVPDTVSSMRRLRILTVLATLLTLPSYGLTGVTHRSCQEQMRASGQVTLAGDCCPGKGDQNSPCQQANNGGPVKNNPCSACKAGYNCKSPQSYEPTQALAWILLPARPTLAVEPSSSLRSRSPDGLWRPPRQI